jgi:hypothetical protein
VAKRKTINRDETRIVDDKTGKLINIEWK